MSKKNLLQTLACLILFIFLANFLANKFYWYYSIWYFDVIMHFLGGVWVGLASLYVFSPKDLSNKLILKVLTFVLVVGLGWEVYEIGVNDIIAQEYFDYWDSASDIFFDLAGGATAILFFFKGIMLKSK